MLVCVSLLLSAPGFSAQAQNSSTPAAPQAADPQPLGRIYGAVTDTTGNSIVGAQVTLLDLHSHTTQVTTTDTSGSFSFSGVPAASYRLSVVSAGFADWTGQEFRLAPGQYEAQPIQLQVAAASTSVRVTVTEHEIAQAQVEQQEKQRVLGVFPNFYTSYVWNAAPMSSGQKFRLALRTSVDPVTFLTAGAIAGVDQWQNYFSGYGQGAEGYADRFGAAYGDAFVGIMLGGAVFPSLLHQDPRYYYKGTGSVRSRALYAISTVVITKGDNGKWQPNYSNVLGTFAAAGIANAYYPASDRNSASVTLGNALIGTASGAISALLQEFVIKKVSTGLPPAAAAQP